MRDPEAAMRRAGADGGQPIRVMLHSGLGNQMFQYAAARAFALRQGRGLVVDACTGFRKDPFQRRYGLDAFRLDSPCLPKAECRAPWPGSRVVFRLTRELEVQAMRRWGRYYLPRLQQVSFACAGAVFGYWQSPRYFAGVEDVLRAEYRLKADPSAEILRQRELLGAGESVAIHVRLIRGHPVAGDAARQDHAASLRQGAAGEYYREAMRWLRARVENPRWFLFTDAEQFDPAWLGLPSGTPVLGSDPARSPAEDLWLLSQARHRIIGPSTFAWWGAWLSGPGRGYVCAPGVFQPGGAARAARDIYPDDWAVL